MKPSTADPVPNTEALREAAAEAAQRKSLTDGQCQVEHAPEDDAPQHDYSHAPAASPHLVRAKDDERCATGADWPEVARPESLTLQEMLERFVHVSRGPVIVDVSNFYRRMRSGEFHAAYAHNKMVIEKKAVPVTALWSQSAERMTADALTFHPGEAQFYMERGLRHFNIWSAPAWPAVDPELAVPLIEHLTYLIPDQRQREDYSIGSPMPHSAPR